MMNTGKATFYVAAWPAFVEVGNPYTTLLYTQIAEQGIEVQDATFKNLLQRPPDVFHLHFPETVMRRRTFLAVVRTLAFAGLLAYLKIRGTKLVWTVHNLRPHEARHPRLSRWFWNFFTRRLDGIVCLTKGGHRSIQDVYPYLSQIPCVVTPHGHYKDHYKDSLTEAQAREQLGIPSDSRVILNFGNLRAYKNIPKLLEVFREIDDPSMRLIIAGGAPGNVDPEQFKSELEELVGGDTRIDLQVRFIFDDEVEIFFKACNLVVLPYTNIQNSGAAILALTFGKRVLVPNIGAMSELQDLCGAEWVILYDGEINADILKRTAMTDGAPGDRGKILEVLDWGEIGSRTIDFYRELAGK